MTSPPPFGLFYDGDTLGMLSITPVNAVLDRSRSVPLRSFEDCAISSSACGCKLSGSETLLGWSRSGGAAELVFFPDTVVSNLKYSTVDYTFEILAHNFTRAVQTLTASVSGTVSVLDIERITAERFLPSEPSFKDGCSSAAIPPAVIEDGSPNVDITLRYIRPNVFDIDFTPEQPGDRVQGFVVTFRVALPCVGVDGAGQYNIKKMSPEAFSWGLLVDQSFVSSSLTTDRSINGILTPGTFCRGETTGAGPNSFYAIKDASSTDLVVVAHPSDNVSPGATTFVIVWGPDVPPVAQFLVRTSATTIGVRAASAASTNMRLSDFVNPASCQGAERNYTAVEGPPLFSSRATRDLEDFNEFVVEIERPARLGDGTAFTLVMATECDSF